jgi:SWI/SNF-related matrix-associated actin-dependent regulator 1 of chromatin subfamily A
MELKHNLKIEPYPYQREGIIFGLDKHRLLIGDEPGLGKTLQSIGIVDTANAYPALVICPSSLKINWQREFEKFTNKKALVLDNATRTAWPYFLQMGMFHVAIVNYESLRKYFVWDINSSDRRSFRLKDVVFNDAIKVFRSVIIDESHRVKDPSAQQTIFARGIAEGKEYRILLSGTPVVNRPADLIAQLSIMGRLPEFGGRAKFLAEYGGGEISKERRAKDEEDAPRNLDRLSTELYSRCMIRREKAKVLTQLPDKTRTDLIVDISNRDEYMLAEADLAEYLRQYTECNDIDIRRKMRMEALVKFMTLRSLSAKGKVKQAIDFVRVFLASGKPLILFCSLHEIVDELCKAFPDAVRVTGRDNATSKQQAVDSFQNGYSQLIVCSIKAAGVGLTLTASSNVAFVEFPWTYADCCQCEDRAHRIGQKDNVTCYYLIGRHTIDRALYDIIHKKKSIANQIMAADDEIPTDEMYFNELAAMILNPDNDD